MEVAIERDSPDSPYSRDPRVRLLRAAGDGARMALLDRLGQGEASVGTLVVYLRMAQPLVSRHLRILRDAGWLRDERRGQRVYYRLDPRALHNMRLWTASLPLTSVTPMPPGAVPPAEAAADVSPGVLFVD